MRRRCRSSRPRDHGGRAFLAALALIPFPGCSLLFFSEDYTFRHEGDADQEEPPISPAPDASVVSYDASLQISEAAPETTALWRHIGRTQAATPPARPLAPLAPVCADAVLPRWAQFTLGAMHEGGTCEPTALPESFVRDAATAFWSFDLEVCTFLYGQNVSFGAEIFSVEGRYTSATTGAGTLRYSRSIGVPCRGTWDVTLVFTPE